MSRRIFLPIVAALAAFPATAQVKIAQGIDKISIAIDGKPYSTFFYGPEVPKPYLYPLLAPSGIAVTRNYPMAKVEGEQTDHTHHRSLWFAHSAVNGYDYWNNEFTYTTPKRGFIYVKSIDKVRSGAKSGEIDETSQWQQGDDNKVVLIENRKMIFYAGGPNRVIDLDFTLTARTTVVFEDAKDGVFGIRVASELEAPNAQKGQPTEPLRTGVMTNAEGNQTEASDWGKRSDWMDYSGVIQGQKVGIAIFDHPENPRHPTYWHARAYGLFAANIFGRSAFSNKQEPDGAITLKPGEKLRFRYRVVIHPGDLNDARISELYKSYSVGK